MEIMRYKSIFFAKSRKQVLNIFLLLDSCCKEPQQRIKA